MPHETIRAALISCSLLAAPACGDGDGASVGVGVPLPVPSLMPAMTLTTTEGARFHLRRDTHGGVTLLFFGYTHCPDVCPIQFANLSAALHRMPVRLARRVRVVFVTTDPERDTPSRLRAWLDAFDPGFVGLTGHPDSLVLLQQRLGLSPAVREPRPDGTYLVGHAAQVIAFGADQVARVAFPAGVRQADWAEALPLLIAGRLGGASGMQASRVVVEDAFAIAAVLGDGAALYFTAASRDTAPDTLVAVDVNLGARTTVHAMVQRGEQMAPSPLVILPAGGRLALRPGEAHVMVEEPWRPIRPGDSLSVELRWARNGRMVLRVAVRGPAEVP